MAEGSGRAGFLRFPFSLQESYRYDRVEELGAPQAPVPATALRPPAPVPVPAPGQLRTAIDSALAFAPADTTNAAGSSEITVNVGGSRDARISSADITPISRYKRKPSARVLKSPRRISDISRRVK